MTEGIDKVKIVLEQEIQDTAAGKEELIIQEGESKTDIEMLYQTNSSRTDNSIVEIEVIPKEIHMLTLEKSKEDYNIIEDVKEIREIETTRIITNQYSDTTEESKEDLIPAESDSSLEKSIWAPSKDRCEGKKNIRAKVAAIKVLGNNANNRENH